MTWFWQSDLPSGLSLQHSIVWVDWLAWDGLCWKDASGLLKLFAGSVFLNSLGNLTNSPETQVRLMDWVFYIELPAKLFQWISGLFSLLWSFIIFLLIHMFLRQEE